MVIVVEVGGLRGVRDVKIAGVVVVVVVVVVVNVVVLIVVGIVGNVKSGRRLGARCVGNGWSKVAEGARRVRWDKVASAVSRGEAAIMARV